MPVTSNTISYGLQVQSKQTAGILFRGLFNASTTLTANLTGFELDLATNVSASTFTVNWLNLSAGAKDLDTTSTWRGLFVDWSSVTRSAGVPILEGIRIELPSSLTGFGSVGIFSGDGIVLNIINGINVLDIGLDVYASGTIIDIAYDTAETLSGNLTGFSLDLETNVANIDATINVTGLKVDMPTVAETGGYTNVIKAIDLTTLGTHISTTASGDYTFAGIDINPPAPNQAFGGTAVSYGIRIDMSVNNPSGTFTYYGIYIIHGNSNSSEGIVLEMTEGNGTETGIKFDGGSLIISSPEIHRGMWVDWNSITRDAGAPVLEGIRIELPADYTNFGTSYGGIYTGDGREFYIIGTSYAFEALGDYNTASSLANFGMKSGATVGAGTHTLITVDGATGITDFTSTAVTVILLNMVSNGVNITTATTHTQQLITIGSEPYDLGNASAVSVWEGINIILPATDASLGGTATARGLNINIGGNTANSTKYGIYINMANQIAGTIAAIKIDNAGAGTIGIDMSTGWAVDEEIIKVVADAITAVGTISHQIAIDIGGTTFYLVAYTHGS